MNPKPIEELGHLSNRVAADYRALADHRMQSLGLHTSQGIVLLILAERGPISLADMAKHLQYTHPSVLRHIDVLEEMELVERTQHPDDRRIKLLSATQKGRDLIPKLYEILAEINRDALKGVTEEERTTLLRVLNQIHENFEALGCPGDIQKAKGVNPTHSTEA